MRCVYKLCIVSLYTGNGERKRKRKKERKKKKMNNKGKRKKAPKNSYVTHTVSCSVRIPILAAVNLVRRKAHHYPPSHAEGVGKYRTLLSQLFRRVRLFSKSFIRIQSSSYPSVHTY